MAGVNRNRAQFSCALSIDSTDRHERSSGAPRDDVRERSSAAVPTLELADSHAHYIGDTLVSITIRECGNPGSFLTNAIGRRLAVPKRFTLPARSHGNETELKPSRI
jgi:hypothetical protein